MKEQRNRAGKPELLLPAGSREAFYAALEAGADAVYLGLESFNARRRASNFSGNNLPAILYEARKRDVKIYITVNTVVKNDELPDLLQLFNLLEKHRVDAVIIQDWGVYHLIKKYFPSLPIHASTQMAVHNSFGVAFAARMGIERVILARELTMSELKKIASEAEIGTEIFVHGALCYSFSGLCLFSSFIGGNGANRGLCAQPCRRLYTQDDTSFTFFNLKDNQQISRVREFAEMGVSSLKVEGRLKPADYVYRVGSAYRSVLDDAGSLSAALKELEIDFGREKTGYFLGGDVSGAIAKRAGTGVYLGDVLQSEQQRFSIKSTLPIQERNRLFVTDAVTGEQTVLKVENVRKEGDVFWIETSFEALPGSPVYMVSENAMHFPNRFPNIKGFVAPRLPQAKVSRIVKSLIPWQERKRKEAYFVRIDTPEWLKNLYMEDYEGIILSFDKETMSGFSMGAPILKQNMQRFWLELPAFISEKDLDFYATRCRAFYKMGIRRFLLSHPSQVMLLPDKVQYALNENSYVFNDAAAAFFTRQKAGFWIYPLENDLKNLLNGSDRNGIVSMYFHPSLFNSRMPVKVSDEVDFTDEFGKSYRKKVRDGITTVIPVEPVVLFPQKKRLAGAGFSRFMIDLSHEKPDRQFAKSLLLKLKASEIVRPSFSFNFLRELK